MRLLNSILKTASADPDATALIQLEAVGSGNVSVASSLSFRELTGLAFQLSSSLTHDMQAGSHIGVVMNNSREWVIADLALLLGKFVEVPAPLAFSAEQASHLLRSCAIVLVDEAGLARLNAWRMVAQGSSVPHRLIHANERPIGDLAPIGQLPEDADRVCKIIHTSGTTSQPKGVMIRTRGLDEMLRSLWRLAEKRDFQRYLSLVPFSLLIEQITALYMPFSAGGCVVLPPTTMAPLGSPEVTAKDRLSLISQARPSALTLTPALVEALAEAARMIPDVDGAELSRQLFGRGEPPFLAVGGAPVAPELLYELHDRGIDVFQGYGLSENTSVVAWNSRGDNRIGTVGRPLPHVEAKLAPGQELCIRSTSLFAGYSNADPSTCHVDEAGWLHTGDIAEIDRDGFIAILGRRKTLIITSNGRNVSPEWLESRYRTVSGVSQVVVFGDRRQFLEGLFLINHGSDPKQVDNAIRDFAQAHLSEIERIPSPILLSDSPDIRHELFTITGRPRRERVEQFINDWKREETTPCTT